MLNLAHHGPDTVAIVATAPTWVPAVIALAGALWFALTGATTTTTTDDGARAVVKE